MRTKGILHTYVNIWGKKDDYVIDRIWQEYAKHLINGGSS